jgi:nanoRNase/pAp phosphatase (c-di-AMP/oligoRNAs hydrolase)
MTVLVLAAFELVDLGIRQDTGERLMESGTASRDHACERLLHRIEARLIKELNGTQDSMQRSSCKCISDE